MCLEAGQDLDYHDHGVKNCAVSEILLDLLVHKFACYSFNDES